MTAQDLLSQLREKGVVLKTSDGDRLVIDAPKGTITDELRDALKAHKSELLQILKSENAPKPPAIAAPKTEPQVADKPAIRCFDQTLTYADTDRLSRNFTAYLQSKLGVAKGDRAVEDQ